MTKEEFGLWIKNIRIECDYTQQKFAEVLGFEHSQSVANIESGKSMLPKKCYRKFIKRFRIDKKQFIVMILKVKMSEYEEDIKDYIYGRKS